MKYHIDTIPVWDAYKHECECPLCEIAQHNEQEYLDVFMGGNIPVNMAAGAMHAVIGNGLKVPYDVEIIGFDNTDISYTSTPQLSTVSQPHQLLGKHAFELLEKVMHKEKTENIILEHRMIFRSSTK